MLAIRMQRTGRKGSAQFRVVVQDSRRTPTSGNIVALVGNYDPHAKVTNIDKDKIAFYLSNGAQPSDRVIRILQHEKVDIPSWVKMPTKKTGNIKNKDKLRKNRPVEEVVAEPEVVEAEMKVDEPVDEAIKDETPTEEVITEEAAEDTTKKEISEEKVSEKHKIKAEKPAIEESKEE